MFESNELQLSGMSHGEQFWKDNKIRGDKIKWYYKNEIHNKFINRINERWKIQETYPNIYHLLNIIDSLREELNKACNLNSNYTQVFFLLKKKR